MKARRELNATLYDQKTNGYIRPTYRTETEQYAVIQGGNIELVKQKLKNGEISLFPDTRTLSDNAFRNKIYHFVIAASAIARACMEGGMGHDEAYALADIYTRKADKCVDSKFIPKLYKEMCLDFTERMQEIKKDAVVSLHVRKCIDYIYEDLHADLSVSALASLTGLNPSYLSRLFSKETGTSIKQFVLAAKIDTAENLLKYSDLSYLDISAALGFSSQSAFICVFKKITGMTPKNYRSYHLRERRDSVPQVP